jgi:uncharacterized Zn-binding protein involved in type VI secretion
MMGISSFPMIGSWRAEVVMALCIAGPWSIAHAQPAARVGDMHTCPLVTVFVPHVGGPILAPGVPSVLIGGMAAAVQGNLATCVGPPDTLGPGSQNVLIGGMPAARQGDMTLHGGLIIAGSPTVLIGSSAKAITDAGASNATRLPERSGVPGNHDVMPLEDHSLHAPPSQRSLEATLGELEVWVDFYNRILGEYGENEAVRNALATSYLLIGSLSEEAGNGKSASDARALALTAIEPAVAEANAPYVLVTYVNTLVLNGRSGDTSPVIGELQRRGWSDPEFFDLCERHGLPTKGF